MKTEEFIEAVRDWSQIRAVWQRTIELRRGRGAGLLSAALVITQALPCRAEFTYSVQNGAVAISGYSGPGGELIVPDTIEGSPVTRIGSGAFYGCTNVTSLTIPASVTTLESSPFTLAVGAFTGCRKLAAIHVDPANGSYSSADGVLFNKTGSVLLACPPAKSGAYAVPAAVTRIAEAAFAGCGQMMSLTISNRVAAIGERAFEGCRGLTSLMLPGIPRIGDRALSDCVSLTNVTIVSGLTQIGNGAFSGCSNLLSVQIPASVKTIGARAFSGCERLQSVALSSNIISLGNRAFYGCDSLSAITVELSNKHYTSTDGVLFNTNQTTLEAFPAGRGGSYTIPATVTDFQDGAFSGCNKLKSIQMSEGMTRLADGAFSGCDSLSQVAFPSSLERIGYSAFYNCGALAHLTFPETLSQLGNGAFYGCGSLEQAYFEGAAPRADSGLASRLCFEPGRATFYYLPGSSGWETFGGRRQLWQPQLQTIGPAAAPQPEGLKLTISWASGRKVAVEASDSLTEPTWSSLGTVILSGGASDFLDPGLAHSARFYRLRAVEGN